MLQFIKKHLYFVGAQYFSFFAQMKLRRWSPQVIVVTGSAGKTTLLHLIEAQLGKKAHYSHHANSAYGIPFDILGLPGVRSSHLDWIKLFVMAPMSARKPVYDQKIYVAEVDTDRPREGAFLANLLKPHITLWVSSLHTHTAQFDGLVASGKYSTPEEAVAADYGQILKATQELVIIDGDNPLMVQQAAKITAQVEKVSISDLSGYQLGSKTTAFQFNDKKYTVGALQPRSVYYQLAMVDRLLTYLKHKPDYEYKKFVPPPGRSSVFEGIQQTTIIDSTYNNSNIDSLKGIVEMFEEYPATSKWLIVSDMIEQGRDEQREHAKIAEVLQNTHFTRIILMGPRVMKYTLPQISEDLKKSTRITVVESPKEVLDFINEHLLGGEVLAFKGVRFLEGVIEALLANPIDAAKLARREPVWQKRRKQWGL